MRAIERRLARLEARDASRHGTPSILLRIVRANGGTAALLAHDGEAGWRPASGAEIAGDAVRLEEEDPAGLRREPRVARPGVCGLVAGGRLATIGLRGCAASACRPPSGSAHRP